MKAKYDNEPLYLIYSSLNNEITNYLNFVKQPKYGLKYKIIDDIIKLLLENNGCKFTSFTVSKEVLISEDCYIYFIAGGHGNPELEFYDYIEFYGSKYIIVFLDYFKGLIPPKYDDPESIDAIANQFMGNYNYTEAIKKIVELYIDVSNCCSGIASSSASNKYYKAPIYISAKIIDNIAGLTENDIGNTMLSYNDIVEKINSMTILALILGLD